MRASLLLVWLLLSTTPLKAIEVNQGNLPGLAEAYGFVLGQKLSLERIAREYPDLARDALLARLSFERTFGDIHSKLQPKMVAFMGEELFQQFLSDVTAQLEQINGQQELTREIAEQFLEEVGSRRAKGDIYSPTLEYLLAIRFGESPAQEYTKGFRQRFHTDGTGKSLGVILNLQLPKSWQEQEGNRPQISENFRASKGFHCESCRLDLGSHKYLLHTHHIDGNKRNNQESNLQALCADCHRKQPLHDYMSIKSKDMALIQRLRKEQGILGSAADWDDLYKLVDPPYDGLLRYLKSAGGGKPEIGYEITDAHGAVVAEVEIAWPHTKDGIVADDAEKKVLEGLGWKAKTLEVALREFREKRF